MLIHGHSSARLCSLRFAVLWYEHFTRSTGLLTVDAYNVYLFASQYASRRERWPAVICPSRRLRMTPLSCCLGEQRH